MDGIEAPDRMGSQADLRVAVRIDDASDGSHPLRPFGPAKVRRFLSDGPSYKAAIVGSAAGTTPRYEPTVLTGDLKGNGCAEPHPPSAFGMLTKSRCRCKSYNASAVPPV